MSIETNKLVNLGDAQVLYNDLRGRVDGKANAIAVADNTSEAVKTITDGSDGMPMEVSVGIEPVQDLHGYEYPWPAGGGKNLFGNGDQTITTAKYQRCDLVKPLPVGDYVVSAVVVSDDIDASTCRIGFYNSNEEVAGTAILLNRNVRSSATVTLESECTFIYLYTSDTAVHGAGDSATYTDIQIESGSTATTYAPYSNICPISGWDQAKVTRTGKNLYDGIIISGYISDDGTEGIDNANMHSNPIKVNPGDNYVYSLTSNTSQSVNRRIHAYDKNGNWLQMISKNVTSGTGHKEFPFTVPNNAQYVKVQFRGGSIADTNIQIESGASFTSYEEPFATTYSITFPTPPGTVYGGTLTVYKDGTGKLVVAHVDADLGMLSGTWSTDGLPLSSNDGISTVVKKPTNATKIDAICSQYSVFSRNGIDSENIGICVNYTGKVIVKDSALVGKTAQEIATYLTGAHFVYPLDTPVEYTLTAQQITSLLGTNNIWADTGNVLSLSYDKPNTSGMASSLSYGNRILPVDGKGNIIVDEIAVITETVSGTTPTITGVANHRYICGECSTLSITPPSSGVIDVIFESGSTATVLTLPNTVKMPEWFEVEADKTYEINIMDGVYGSVMAWA